MFQHHDSTDAPTDPAGAPTLAQEAHAHHYAGHTDRSEIVSHRSRASNALLNRVALLATIHCLSGCAIGEVLGIVIGTALGLSNGATIALAVVLAFGFGYALTMLPLLRHGVAPRQALKLALASDTASITIMEVVDNLMMLVIPGAMSAGLGSPLFWGSLAGSLVIAGIAAFPVNRWLIGRGRGHAVVHGFHGHT